jgi:bacillithiol system protein YtxJ
MLKDRIFNLPTPEAVEGFLQEYPSSVIFKAGTCHKTMQGFGFLQEKLAPREDLPIGVIRVVEARPASNLVSQKTGLTHESPQVILFKGGQAVFEANNWDITPEALEQGLSQVPAGEAVGIEASAASSDLGPYRELLEQYLSGVLDERQFEYAYTSMFREDANLRSAEEVEVLGSIFGDVDRHAELHRMMGGYTNSEVVRQRAQVAFERLNEL